MTAVPDPPTLELLDLVLRILVGTAVGAAVGLERELRGQHAGMRTHALVSGGSALFTLVGAYGFSEHVRGLQVDPMRVAAQVASGIGFIGAGAILRSGNSVRGVTTAAALWTTAALGMAAGAGMYLAATIGALTVLGSLVGLRIFRERGLTRLVGSHEHIEVAYERGYGTLAPVITAIENAGASLANLRIHDGRNEMRRVNLVVHSRQPDLLRAQFAKLADRPEVQAVEFDAQLESDDASD